QVVALLCGNLGKHGARLATRQVDIEEGGCVRAQIATVIQGGERQILRGAPQGGDAPGALFHVVDVAHTRGRVVDVASLVDGVTGDPQRESVRDERHVDMATDTKARVIG